MTPTTCKACGAPLYIVETQKGKAMYVDTRRVPFVPDIHGVDHYVTEDGYTIRGVMAMEGDPDIHIGYISHIATCAARERFRRR